MSMRRALLLLMLVTPPAAFSACGDDDANQNPDRGDASSPGHAGDSTDAGTSPSSGGALNDSGAPNDGGVPSGMGDDGTTDDGGSGHADSTDAGTSPSSGGAPSDGGALSNGGAPSEGGVPNDGTAAGGNPNDGGTDDAAGAGGAPASSGFRVALEEDQLSVPRGASVWIGVRVERDPGFTDDVTIRVEDPPSDLATETLVLPTGVESGVLPVFVSEGLEVQSALDFDVVGTSGSAVARASVQLTITDLQPTGQELIATALAAGTIDYETSLLYRAYALWGDNRLPAEYAGWGSLEEDNGLFDEIRRASLSANAMVALEPFTARPHAPESIWGAAASALESGAAQLQIAAAGPPPATCPAESGAAGTWISRRSATEPVRAWAQCPGDPAGDAESERLVGKLLGVLDKIWGPMTDAMTAPLTDLEGGDEAIDFYIVDPGVSVYRRTAWFAPHGLGSTYSDFPEVANGASAFVTLPRSLAYTSRFHTTVIHELFHVLQKAYNHVYSPQNVSAVATLYESHWFVEASAVWASAHFDRTLAPWPDGRGAYMDAHRRFVQVFQPSPLGLSASSSVPHAYAAYIWPYFVEQETESADFMAQIWEGIAPVTSYDAADDAIDAAYAFQDNFKTFALRNLNVPFLPGDPLPPDERYHALDSDFPDGPPAPPHLQGALEPDVPFTQALDLPNLGTRYVMLTADATIRKVEVDFSGLQLAENVDVLALAHDGDEWLADPLDFSDDDRVVFCFDDGKITATRRGRFSSMLLAISNHAVRSSDRVSGDLVVRPESEPCTPVWTGTITSNYVWSHQDGTTTITTSTPVTFEYDDSQPPPPYTILYRLRSGTYDYSFVGDFNQRTPPCTTTQTETGTMIPSALGSVESGASFGNIEISTLYDPPTHRGSGFTIVNGTATTTCNDDNTPVTYDSTAQLLWWTTANLTFPVSDDRRTLQGSVEYAETSGAVQRYDWNLVRVDE